MAKPSEPLTTAPAKANARSKSEQKTKRTGPNNRVQAKPLSSGNNALARPGTKLARLIALLSKEEGATIGDLTKATDWQAHSVRGAISGTLKKKLGLTVASEPVEGRGRVYHISNNG